MQWLFGVVRILIGLLLIVSAWSSRREGQTVVTNRISGYKLASPGLARAAAVVLGPAEFILGILLVFGVSPSLMETVCAGLFFACAAVVAQAAVRGLGNECRCFGVLRSAHTNWGIAAANAVIGAAMLASALSSADSGKRLALYGADAHMSAGVIIVLIIVFAANVWGNVDEQRKAVHGGVAAQHG